MSGPFNDLDPDQSPAAPAEAGTADRDHATTPAPPPRVIKAALRDEPGVVTALVRGATKRCPRCGSGALFKGWFTIRDRCPGCGLRLEREEGGFLGAMVLSYLVTEGILLALLIAWLIVDLPDLYVGALTVASIAVAGMIPVLFWPFSKTIWASVDYFVYRTSPDYTSREAADHASGNGGRP